MKFIGFSLVVFVAVVMISLVFLDGLFYTNPASIFYPFGEKLQHVLLDLQVNPVSKEEISLEIADINLTAMSDVNAHVVSDASEAMISADHEAQTIMQMITNDTQRKKAQADLQTAIGYQRTILESDDTKESLQVAQSISTIVTPIAVQSGVTTMLSGIVYVVDTNAVCVGQSVCGAPISHLKLVFTLRDANTQYSVNTDINGQYQVSLVPGRYIISSTGPIYTKTFMLTVTGKTQSYTVIFDKG